MEHMSTFLTILTLISGWGFSVWALVKYLIDRMDEKMQNERDQRIKAQDDLHSRIEHVKEKYVLREDFHRYMDDVKSQIGEIGKGINSRMDQLFLALAGGPTKKE